MCFDLNKDSCLINEANNIKYIIEQKYKVINKNLVDFDFGNNRFDIIISCMVIEHLEEILLTNTLKNANRF